MVFAGQDAWRKHPLLSGNWKKPFPGVGTAAVLFARSFFFFKFYLFKTKIIISKKYII
jgi:hypothetical protein